MSAFLPANIKGCPFGIPIKRYTILPLIEVVEFLKLVVLYGSRTLLIKQAESNFILCVRLREKMFKVGPVLEGNLSNPSSVGNMI